MSGWRSTYSTGTISIGAGATSVVGSGTLWGPLEDQANLLIVGNQVAFVSEVVDDTHLTIPAWAGGAVSGEPYVLVQFPLASLAATRELRDALAKLRDIGVIYYVSGDAPNDEIGADGDFALKINSGPFKMWLKASGVWVLQGTPSGFTFRGAWTSGLNALVGDIVTRNGKAYVAILPGTNHPPESSPTYWSVFVSNGDRYDLAIFDTDRPGSGELIAKLIVPKGMTLTYRAGLGESNANAEVAATGTAVFSIRKNGTQFATLTFTASAAGVFACVSDVTLAGNSNDVLTIIAPNPRDATLSGVSAVLAGYRS